MLEWYARLWWPAQGRQKWTHMYLLIPQSQFLAALPSEYHIDVDRAPLQTIGPTGSPFGAMISPKHLNVTMQQGHGIPLLHVHTSMVECLVRFQGTWPWYQGTTRYWWCPSRVWHHKLYSWCALSYIDRCIPQLCARYFSLRLWTHYKNLPCSLNWVGDWVCYPLVSEWSPDITSLNNDITYRSDGRRTVIAGSPWCVRTKEYILTGSVHEFGTS